MKNWAASFLNMMRGRTTTLATIWRIIRTDAQAFGHTDCSRNLVIDGLTYSATTGLQTSVVQKSDTLAVDTIDITAFLYQQDEGAIEAGLWDGAQITIVEVDYTNLPATFDVTKMNVLRDGVLGRIQRQDQRFTAEIRNKMTRLDTHIGAQYTLLCPWVLGDPLTCGRDLTVFTATGTVTSVGTNPRTTFFASGQVQAPGYFSQGRLTFTSGANDGYSMDIRHWNPPKFSLNRPMPYAIAIGDDFTAVHGDDHTFKTCRDVFNNVQRFRGFIHLPGIDKLVENPVHWQQRPVPSAPPDGNPDNDPGNDPNGDGNDDDGNAND